VSGWLLFIGSDLRWKLQVVKAESAVNLARIFLLPCQEIGMAQTIQPNRNPHKHKYEILAK
jgi:hypothetical protein